MPAQRRGLSWVPESVATILHINNIRTREELARAVGVGVNTIYRCFPAESEWAGEATTLTLYALAYAFDVPLSSLVYEPKSYRAEQKPGRGRKRSA